MKNNDRIYIAGHRGLVGSAVKRKLESEGFTNLVYRSSSELDLTDKAAVDAFFSQEKPDYVFLAAAKVGGIVANDTYPADFIRINLEIQTNVIDAACRHGVKKLLFLGSSCIYPKFAPQPMKEEHLLTGELEPTNIAYAIAKISGIIMCSSYNMQHETNFIATMPTNLYGPNDNFDLETSHVLPALIRRFHEAKQNNEPAVTLWGTGKPMREFLYVDDLADALLFLMHNFDASKDSVFVNVGVGEDISIRDLAYLIREIVGFKGDIRWDTGKPDGTPRKLMDVERLKNLGWQATTSLKEGIEKTYTWYLHNRDTAA